MADPGISSHVVAAVAQALAELGFEAPRPPSGATPVVAGSNANALADAAVARLGDPALGLAIAARVPIGALGPLDYALVTSQRVREALKRTARYYAAATQRVRLTLVEEGTSAELRYTRLPGVVHHRVWMEFSVAIMLRRLSACLGQPFKPTRVDFAHACLGDEAPYRRVLGGPVHFGQPSDRIVFDRKLLDLPLQTAQAQLVEVLERQLALLAPAEEIAPFALQVRQLMVQALARRDTSFEVLTRGLSLPRRTVQRELQRLGTSHRALLDKVRQEQALVLLESGALDVTEVALRLGFSEASAFFRAFKRWTGRSPTAVRARGA